MELNSELMDNILNTYQYAGKMNYENIMNWVNIQRHRFKHAKLKLDSTYDGTEAASFIEKHGYRKILDITETQLPCILLVPGLADDQEFLKMVQLKSTAQLDQEKIKTNNVLKTYSIRQLTKIESLYNQLDRIYKNEKQGFKIYINFGYIVENKAESKYEHKSPKQNEKFSDVVIISCKNFRKL